MCQEVEKPITLVQVVTIKGFVYPLKVTENQMGKSFRRDDFSDRLGGQTVLLIG